MFEVHETRKNHVYIVLLCSPTILINRADDDAKLLGDSQICDMECPEIPTKDMLHVCPQVCPQDTEVDMSHVGPQVPMDDMSRLEQQIKPEPKDGSIGDAFTETAHDNYRRGNYGPGKGGLGNLDNQCHGLLEVKSENQSEENNSDKEFGKFGHYIIIGLINKLIV